MSCLLAGGRIRIPQACDPGNKRLPVIESPLIDPPKGSAVLRNAIVFSAAADKDSQTQTERPLHDPLRSTAGPSPGPACPKPFFPVAMSTSWRKQDSPQVRPTFSSLPS